MCFTLVVTTDIFMPVVLILWIPSEIDLELLNMVNDMKYELDSFKNKSRNYVMFFYKGKLPPRSQLFSTKDQEISV